MATETERKFLVTSDAWRDLVRGQPTAIAQGYLHVDAESEVRVRLQDDADALLTVKRGGRSVARTEVEVPIGRAEARQLLDEAVVGVVLSKRRHLVDLPAVGDAPALVAEVDAFDGAHAGLVIAEVELPDADTPLPDVDWLGDEVTGNPAYYNATLATG